ncbi:methyltransferase [Candidatus Woesearchaeota archaeon]|nr:methyltransferase [Candidatus Woesearchaeota archaeon]
MNILISTYQGLEDISIKEIKEITKKQAKIDSPSILILKNSTQLDLFKIIYCSRSINKATILIDSFNFKTLQDITNKISLINFKKYVSETFSVSCKRTGNHDFNSKPVFDSTVKIISNKYNIQANYKNPNTTIVINIINDKCYISIDLLNIELNKRKYKVKTSYLDINSCLAFSLLKIAEFNNKKKLLDPFCGNSSIVIEAALLSSRTPNLHNNNKIPKNIITQLNKTIKKIKTINIFGLDSKYINVKNSRINSKVAQISNLIDFQNYDLEWIDTKFKQNSIDLIVTNPPIITKRNEKDIVNLYKQLFYQASYILSKKGNITLITTNPEAIINIAQEYSFIAQEKRKVLIGNLNYEILKLKCNLKKS